MTSPLTLLTLWNWSSVGPWVGLGLLAVDLASIRGRCRSRIAWLFVALAMFVLAFVSPIGVLADGYSFSAHVVQHLLFLLAIPLCYLLSLPERSPHKAAETPSAFRFASILGDVCRAPQFGWVCGLGAMWLWHVPTLCHAAAQSASIGTVRDASLLVAGIAFWWPIFSPAKASRLAPPVGALYLFSACIGCTLLGIYITFTPVSVCPIFAHPVDRLGILPLLHEMGLTHAADQTLGGLLMWVPPCLVYGGVIIGLLGQWYAPAKTETAHAGAATPLLAPIGKGPR